MKHFSTRFLASLLMCVAGWAQTAAFTVNGLNYEEDDEGGVILTGPVSQSITSVSIPADVTYNGSVLTVNSIRSNAFHECGNLKEVRIEDAPTMIYCSPYTDENGESVYDSPFCFSPVESFYIGRDFAEGDNVSRSRTVRVVYFASKAPTLNLSFGGRIGRVSAVFSTEFQQKVRSLSLSGNIGGFSTNVFSGMTNLKSLSLGSGNYKISASTFPSVTFENVTVSDPTLTQMPISTVKTVTFGEGWTAIPSNFLNNNKYIEAINFPSTLTEIGDDAFSYCTSLKSINFPASLRRIGDGAFFNCRLLEYPGFPEGLEEIGSNAFSWCDKFTEIVIPGSVTQIGSTAFEIHNGTYKSITISPSPDGSELNVTGWFVGHTSSVDSLVLNRVVTLNDVSNKFLQCHPKHVVFGEGWTSIPSNFFVSYHPIETVEFPSTLVEIEQNAFQNIETLKTVNFPESLRRIGDGAFFNCRLLEYPGLPEGLEEIGSNAFSWCDKFTEIVIPGSVTQIGSYAFDGTYKSITISPSQYGSGLNVTGKFLGTSNIDTLIFNRVITLVQETNQFLQCKPKHVVFGEGWTSIPAGFMVYTSGVETIALPSTLTAIGQSAFVYCSNPQTITSLAKKAPVCDGSGVFNFAIYPTAELTVPVGSRRAYASAEEWKNFANIRTDGVLLATVDYDHERGAVKINDQAIDSLEVDEGDPVNISIMPATGFAIKSVTANGEDCIDKLTGNTLHYDEISDTLNVAIDFAPIMFAISVPAEIEGGSIAVNGSIEPEPVKYGSRVELRATPSEGYLLKSLNVNGQSVTTDDDGVYTIESLTENLTVSATFEIIRFSAAAVYDPAMGSVKLNDVEGQCLVDYGKPLTITVTPAEGRYIRSISINGSEVSADDMNAPVVIERVLADTEVRVEFAIHTFTIAANYDNNMGSVTINGSEGSVDAEWGSDVLVAVAPAYGYQTASVMLDGEDVTSKLDASGSFTVKNVKANHAVEVNFEVKRVRLSLSGLEGGKLTTVHNFGAEVRYIPEPVAGWEFHSATAGEHVITALDLDSDGAFTVGPLTDDTVLSVVFLNTDPSAEANAPIAADRIKVTVKDRTINIDGAPDDAVASVFDTAGIRLYSGLERCIGLPGSGVYLVNIAGQTFKVLLR